MVNPEEVLQSLDEFSKLKPKDIPRELEEYLMYVAKTGDPVYQWSLVKCLFREKMLNVITDFYESCPSIDLPPCPNVDPFNYETMKASLLERLESFSNAPFTVQRLSELLTTPRKEYTRVDKFMRAIEKNILVVSTKEPGGSRARPDAPPQQSQADVLMNGVMDGRSAGGLDIGEAIETVSTEGVNLMHSSEAVAEGTDVALADSIRVECEDVEMDDASAAPTTTTTAVVWDTKAGGECGVAADGLKTVSATPDSTASPSGATVVWDGKAEECGVNGDGLKVMDTPAETSTAAVWDAKDTECGESLKTLSPTPESAPTTADPPAASKPAEDEDEVASVAVVSEFLTPIRKVFGQPVELSAGVEAVPLVLATAPDPEQRSVGVATGVPAECTVEIANHELAPVVTSDPVAKVEEPQPSEQVAEADSKEVAEAKESESEDASQIDAESGISCSADSSSASSDCATAEMNQTLETNGTLEITSVESEVMSPLEGLEDVTANISPPSPDTGSFIALDSGETTPPPTFAEMTADEDTQDAIRSADPPDDEAENETEQEEPKPELGTKLESTPEPDVPAATLETKMDVDEPPLDDIQTEEPVVEQCVLEVPAEAGELQSQTSSQDETAAEQAEPSVLPHNTV